MPNAAVPEAPPSVATVRLEDLTTLSGVCDGSGAALIDERWLVLASDADPALVVYDPLTGSSPVHRVALPGVEDLEGLAVLGSDLWALASHDAADGTERVEARQALLRIPFTVAPTGPRFASPERAQRLIDDGQWTPQLLGIVGNTKGRRRTDAYGLSLEGLASAEEALVLGFRTPVHAGKALVQRLENPVELVAGKRPSFRGPRWLDLGARGIRAMARHDGGWWLIAGPIADEGDFVLARWVDFDQVRPPETTPLVLEDGFVPEALVSRGGHWWVVSDDGDRTGPDGVACDQRGPADRAVRLARLSVTDG